MRQPLVRVHLLWQGRQAWQLRGGHAGRAVATREGLIGTFGGVVEEEGVGHLTHLPLGSRPQHLQAFFAKRTMIVG